MGLSLEVAARRLRISTSTLKVYERGRGKNRHLAGKIARLYGVSVFGALTEQGVAIWKEQLRQGQRNRTNVVALGGESQSGDPQRRTVRKGLVVH